MTKRDAPEKRDPADFSLAEIRALLRSPFPTTIEEAIAEGLPEHDYTSRGQRIWEGHKVSTWIEATFQTIKERSDATRAMLDAEHARLEVEYRRGQATEEPDGLVPLTKTAEAGDR